MIVKYVLYRDSQFLVTEWFFHDICYGLFESENLK